MYGLQRGGMQFLFTKYKTLKELRTAMVDLNSKGKLPIPSQKRGICATDGLTVSLWYSDILGEYLWNKYVFANGGLIDTHDVEKGPRTPEEASQGVLPLMAYRVARIIQSMSAEIKQGISYYPGGPLPPPTISRTESAQGDTAIPTGEICSNLIHIIKDKEQKGDPQAVRESHGLSLAAVADTIALEFLLDHTLFVNVEFVYSANLEKVLKTGILSAMQCVAAMITVRAPDGRGHLFAVVRMNGIWTLMDNNIGVAVALPELNPNDIFTARFGLTYTGTSTGGTGGFWNQELNITFTDDPRRTITKVTQQVTGDRDVREYGRTYKELRSGNREYIFVNPRLLAAPPGLNPNVQEFVPEGTAVGPEAVGAPVRRQPPTLDTQLALAELNLVEAEEDLAKADGAAGAAEVQAKIDALRTKISSLKKQLGRGRRRTHRKRVLRSGKFGYRSRRNDRGRSSRVI